jgi:UDP-N-acetylmuramoyl-L-alanyl-D-glutamate--2,6-diaminopimelate ligase
MEVVGYKPFVALIDFAHTPHAIEQALSAIRKKYPQGTLIHVFGSAAKRDVTKRPRMGASSASFADITVLTEEDHRDENPLAIAQDIAKGLESKGFQFHTPAELLRTRAHKSYCYVYDREQALAYACKIAKPGDIVVATGKGHEKSLARGGKEYSYDERAIFERLLRDLI